MKLLLLLPLALLLAGLSSAEPASRPNILMIIVDDMNHYGFHGSYPGIRMPALDQLKQQSITFKNAFCAAPVCGPSRAAVFSGLYPHTTGAYLNGADPWRTAPLDQTESLVELFQRSGYLTYGNGKIFHAALAEGRLEAMFTNQPFGGGFGPFLPEGDEFPIPGDRFWISHPWTGPDEDFPDVRNLQSTVEFLKEDHDKPFFAVLGLWRPHTPFTAPKRFFDIYDKEEKPLPPGYREDDLSDLSDKALKLTRIWGKRWDLTGASNPDHWRHMLWGYAAATSFADWTVGEAVKALDASSYADNTILILWSDNGYHMGEKNHYEKATLWELSARTPMLVRLPGHRNGGAVCTRPVSSIDLFPTLVELCRLEAPARHPEGTSLAPLLKNPFRQWKPPVLTSYGEGLISVRDERFRYIRYPDGSEELYDHEVDPHEWNNLAPLEDYNKVKRRLSAHLPGSYAPSLGGRNG